MSYMVAIESDAKVYKEIQESWADVARELSHEVLLFKSLAEFKADIAKPENANKAIVLLMVGQDQLKGELKAELEELRFKYKCDLLLSTFDDPVKPIKKSEDLPVQNIIYKPFDLTILKEHTRFAILRGQKLKSSYVHTTQVDTKIEALKRFKILEISEFAFKIDKAYDLKINHYYKFYHPLFANKKSQHAWGRVINSASGYYELVFAQTMNPVLAQIRRKVATSTSKVKVPNWIGLSENQQEQLKVGIQITDEAVEKALTELLTRNFKDIDIIGNKRILPKLKIDVDVLITEIDHNEGTLNAQFKMKPLVIRIFDQDLPREMLEERLQTEFIRMEKPIDRALLVKFFKLFFPKLVEADEEIQRITAQINEQTMIAEVLQIQDFSEAAITFTCKEQRTMGEFVEIALPREDEASLQEIKAKINFASDAPAGDKDKVYSNQLVLFGMKDESLKSLRLWALQQHISKKK